MQGLNASYGYGRERRLPTNSPRERKAMRKAANSGQFRGPKRASKAIADFKEGVSNASNLRSDVRASVYNLRSANRLAGRTPSVVNRDPRTPMAESGGPGSMDRPGVRMRGGAQPMTKERYDAMRSGIRRAERTPRIVNKDSGFELPPSGGPGSMDKPGYRMRPRTGGGSLSPTPIRDAMMGVGQRGTGSAATARSASRALGAAGNMAAVGGAMQPSLRRAGAAMRTPSGKGIMAGAGLLAAAGGAELAKRSMKDAEAPAADLRYRRVGGYAERLPKIGRSAVGEVRSRAGSKGLKEAVGYAVSAVQRNERSGSIGSLSKYRKAMQGSEQYRKLSASDKAKANTALQQWADTQSAFRKKAPEKPVSRPSMKQRYGGGPFYGNVPTFNPY